MNGKITLGVFTGGGGPLQKKGNRGHSGTPNLHARVDIVEKGPPGWGVFRPSGGVMINQPDPDLMGRARSASVTGKGGGEKSKIFSPPGTAQKENIT